MDKLSNEEAYSLAKRVFEWQNRPFDERDAEEVAQICYSLLITERILLPEEAVIDAAITVLAMKSTRPISRKIIEEEFQTKFWEENPLNLDLKKLTEKYLDIKERWLMDGLKGLNYRAAVYLRKGAELLREYEKRRLGLDVLTLKIRDKSTDDYSETDDYDSFFSSISKFGSSRGYSQSDILVALELNEILNNMEAEDRIRFKYTL